MSTPAPLQVLKRYQQELWNNNDMSKIHEILSLPMRRHYPGKMDILDEADIRARFAHFNEGVTDINFYSVFDICDGPFVTSVWETTATRNDGNPVWTAGIEVFKVENGLITDVWNGHAVDGEWAWNVLWDKTLAAGQQSDFASYRQKKAGQ